MKNVFDWVRRRLGKTQEVEFILTVGYLMRSWEKYWKQKNIKN